MPRSRLAQEAMASTGAGHRAVSLWAAGARTDPLRGTLAPSVCGSLLAPHAATRHVAAERRNAATPPTVPEGVGSALHFITVEEDGVQCRG